MTAFGWKNCRPAPPVRRFNLRKYDRFVELARAGAVTDEGIAEVLGVSMATVRGYRDLAVRSGELEVVDDPV